MKKLSTQVPRLALTPSEAAASIGVGPDFFEAHVAPELRIVRRGRKRLISLAELERWLAANADDSVAQEINTRP